MADYTSTQTGNWSEPATWGGGGVPGIDDTATLGHDVTVNQATIVGTSPAAGTNAIAIAAGGKLTVDAPLEARGDISVTGGSTNVKRTIIEITAGNGIEFNASQATDPTNQNYTLVAASANFQWTFIDINGTPGNRCYIRSNAGGGNASISRSSYVDVLWMNATYCDFTRIGTASTSMARPSLREVDGGEWQMTECTFDECGEQEFSVIGTANEVAWINCTWVNTLSTYTINATAGMSDPAGGKKREMSGCIHDGRCDMQWARGAVIGANNVFLAGTLSSTASARWASFSKYNFFSGPLRNGVVINGDVPEFAGYVYNNRSGSNDRHCLSVGGPTEAGTTNLQDIIYESTGTGTAGNGILTTDGSAVRTYNVRRMIVLPNSDGHGSGNLIHHYAGGTNPIIDVKNCTAHISGEGGGINALSDNVRFSQVRDTIFYDTTPDRSHKITTTGTATSGDTIFGGGGNVTHNCGFQNAAGSQGGGYDIGGWTVAPGANDIDGEDPQFVDGTRKLGTWDAALGGDGSEASALARLANRTNTVQDLVDWVAAGFAPQNTNLKGSASDGGDRGAVPVAGTVITTTVTATNAAGSDQEQFTWTEVDPP